MHGTPKDRTKVNEIYEELDKLRARFDNPEPTQVNVFALFNMAEMLEMQERCLVLELGRILQVHVLENNN